MKQNWYEQTTEQVFAFFNSSFDGLSHDLVLVNQERYGQNKLPEAKTDSLFLIFLRQFTSPLVYILLAVSIIVLAIGDVTDAIVIFIVLFLNAVIGTVQEGRAQNTLAALKRFVQTMALVRRSGVETMISDTALVPGDIVIIREGDKVPADGRIILSHDLNIDEASLTGESEPVQKIAEFLSRQNTDPDFQTAQQRNMLFKGTHAVSGRGEMLVTAIGSETEIGKISATIAKEGETEIPLQGDVRNLSRMIMLIVLTISLVLFIIGIALGEPILQMLKTVVSLAVSIIPEGLPVVMTLVLANGVWRMGQRKALVKKLAAVEALGQADVIAVDKTGTITKNELVVEVVVVKGKTFSVTGNGYEPKGDILDGRSAVSPLDIPELVLAGKIASFAAAELIYVPEKQTWQVSGDPTEGALLVLAQKVGFKPEDMQTRHPVTQDIAFGYKSKFHGVVYKDDEAKHTLAVVGAPEAIAKLCHIPEKDIHQTITPYVSEGLRVVAFAFAHVREGIVDANNIPKMTFGGLYGMRDSMHAEVPAAVQAVKAGGIRVMMITGDHKLTAQAIAKQANIFEPGDTVVTGDQLETMTDQQLKDQLKTVSVFARVTPYHKLRIVQALKASGHIVAMTGDGVNDVPSLVAADLGIAMGRTGTDVTKEAADIILLDDNFATIASAVEEGRGIYKTIERALLYLFSTGMGELFTIALALFIGWPLPVVAVQILWLNFVTDGFLTVAFAMEPSKDAQLLKAGKFKTHKYLISKPMLWRMSMMGLIMTISTLGLFYFYKDGDYLKASTIAVTILAVLQWVNAWNCRSEKTSALRNIFTNPYLIIATLVVIVMQLLAVYHPLFQKFLKTVPLEPSEWLIILALSIPLLLIEEIRKFIARR
jgi:magnesium-transporting ATPase (P-type)